MVTITITVKVFVTTRWIDHPLFINWLPFFIDRFGNGPMCQYGCITQVNNTKRNQMGPLFKLPLDWDKCGLNVNCLHNPNTRDVCFYNKQITKMVIMILLALILRQS